jgi:hypothetical protein
MFSIPCIVQALVFGGVCAIAAFLVGRKYPKIANVIATEANKVAGK